MFRTPVPFQPASWLAGAASAQQRFPCLPSALLLRTAGPDDAGSDSDSSSYLSSGSSSYGLYSEDEDEGEGGEMGMRALLGALPEAGPCDFWTEERLRLFQVGCSLVQPAAWHSVQHLMPAASCSPVLRCCALHCPGLQEEHGRLPRVARDIRWGWEGCWMTRQPQPSAPMRDTASAFRVHSCLQCPAGLRCSDDDEPELFFQVEQLVGAGLLARCCFLLPPPPAAAIACRWRQPCHRTALSLGTCPACVASLPGCRASFGNWRK